MPNASSLFFSALLAYAWLGAAGNFLLVSGMLVVTSLTWKLAFTAAVFMRPGIRVWNGLSGGRRLPLPELEVSVFAVAFALFLFTDFTARRGVYHIDPVLMFELGLAGILFLYLAGRRTSEFSLKYLFSWPLLLIVQAALTAVFLGEADGRLIWSDDHPSFLYRLMLLKERFPDVVAYTTLWNGGYPTREIFPTGTVSLFLLGLPFMPFIGLDTLEHAARYTWLVPYLFVFLIPWSIYTAARFIDIGRPGATAAGLLALAPSTSFFEFALKYGTLPFIVSAGLVPLGTACVLRLGFGEKAPRWRFVFFAVGVLFLCLCWHLMALAFVPLALLVLSHHRQLRADRRAGKIAAAAVFTVLLLAPSQWSIISDSPIPAMLSGTLLPGSKTEAAKIPHTADKKRAVKPEAIEPAPTNFGMISVARQNFSRHSGKANTLLLALALPACLLLPRGPKRGAVGGAALWALAVGIFGQQVKPQLELHRFVLVAEFLATVACGRVLELLFEEQRKFWHRDGGLVGRSSALASAGLVIAIGGILSAPIFADRVYRNGAPEQRFVFAPPELAPFIDAIREHGGAGRVFFSGFVLHDFGAKHYDTQDGGHIAPLPFLTERPMYASHFSHAYWSTVDPIPEEFRENDGEGIEKFLDLVNATSVVTFKREWTRFCKRDPRYTRVWHHGRFHLFTRVPASSGWFAEGRGEVEYSHSSVTVIPETEDIILKFRWFPKLKTDRPDIAEVSGEPVFIDDMLRDRNKQAYFIRLKTAPEALADRPRITISY